MPRAKTSLRENKTKASMSTICSFFGMSKSGYYKKLKMRSLQLAFEDDVLSRVRKIRMEHSFYGVRKIFQELKRDGYQISRDKLWRVLQRHNMMLPLRYRRVKTTIPGWIPYQPRNLVKDIEITSVHQVWFSDITYILTLDGMVYLSTIMDAYSRKIISHIVSTDITAKSLLCCLSKVIKSVSSTNGIIHHSDRGSQYCSNIYRSTLENNGFQLSYTGRDHCYDNAKMERFFNTLKHEYKLKGIVQSKARARELIDNAIDDYNNRRIHAALNYKTPQEVYNAA
ncbi:MAG: IS3 family transposase [Candidatus Cloacimonetes bacterium]|nr:IS3 family transposase [Candidatus Cloacimonadota bacterium]